MKNKHLSLALIMNSIFALHVAGAENVPLTHRTLDDLSFLRGTWSGKSDGGSLVEEYWSSPQADSMIGHCKFTKGGKTTFYELLAIVKTPGGIALKMKHFNESFIGWEDKDEAGDCVLVTCTPSEAIFNNNKSAHRVRVTYRRTGPNSLHTVVEDIRDGKTSTYPFEYSLIE
jgi:hypothetical protein